MRFDYINSVVNRAELTFLVLALVAIVATIGFGLWWAIKMYVLTQKKGVPAERAFARSLWLLILAAIGCVATIYFSPGI